MDSAIINTHERRMVYELAKLEALERMIGDVALQLGLLDSETRTDPGTWTKLDEAGDALSAARKSLKARIVELTVDLERYDLARAEDEAA